MMEIFYESKDVKDLEKIVPKLKGITSMSVKDVVTSLVDDGLVDTEKIGTKCLLLGFSQQGHSSQEEEAGDGRGEEIEG